MSIRATLGWLWPPFGLSVAVCVLTLLASQGSQELHLVATEALINAMLVVALYMFSGLSGVVSFGHLGFMAVGAYVDALVTMPAALKPALLPNLPGFVARTQVGVLPGILIAAAAAAVVGSVAALLLMRLSGIAAAIGTFALLIIIYIVASNWTAVTNGTQAMVGVPIDTGLGTALVWTVIAIVGAYALQESRLGMRLRASREDEVAAKAIGVRVARERAVALVASAAVAGAAGALYGHLLGSFGPDAFYLDSTFLVLAMLIVGGLKSLTGAVTGTVVVSVIAEVLRRIEEGTSVGGVSVNAPAGTREIVLGLVLLTILIFRPHGITGGRELGRPDRLIHAARGALARARGGGRPTPVEVRESESVE